MKYYYECKECGYEYEVEQSMKDDRFEKHHCEKCDKVTNCFRVVYGGTGVIWKGGAPTISTKTRGYTGKFQNKIRPVGSPVEAPTHKVEADRQFQNWVDSGGLTGVEPTMDLSKTPIAPQTAEQMVDKDYTPGWGQKYFGGTGGGKKETKKTENKKVKKAPTSAKTS